MKWEFDNSRPIYLQLVEQLKFQILAGTFPPGGKLESVRDLSREAGVNPNTMQRALQELEREYLIFTNRTTGRFVTEDEELLAKMRKEIVQNKMAELIHTFLQMGFQKDELVELITSYLEGEKGHE